MKFKICPSCRLLLVARRSSGECRLFSNWTLKEMLFPLHELIIFQLVWVIARRNVLEEASDITQFGGLAAAHRLVAAGHRHENQNCNLCLCPSASLRPPAPPLKGDRRQLAVCFSRGPSRFLHARRDMPADTYTGYLIPCRVGVSEINLTVTPAKLGLFVVARQLSLSVRITV
jgi:hypothetical protein